jgi:hypothetical protein
MIPMLREEARKRQANAQPGTRGGVSLTPEMGEVIVKGTTGEIADRSNLYGNVGVLCGESVLAGRPMAQTL